MLFNGWSRSPGPLYRYLSRYPDDGWRSHPCLRLRVGTTQSTLALAPSQLDLCCPQANNYFHFENNLTASLIEDVYHNPENAPALLDHLVDLDHRHITPFVIAHLLTPPRA